MTDPTLGEAHRRIDRIETRLDSRLVSLSTYQAEHNADRETITRLRADLTDDLQNLRLDLQAVQERLTWAWRAAVTGVILPLVITFGVLLFRQGSP